MPTSSDAPSTVPSSVTLSPTVLLSPLLSSPQVEIITPKEGLPSGNVLLGYDNVIDDGNVGMEYWCTLYNGSVIFSTEQGREVLSVVGDEDITSPEHITTFTTSSTTQTLFTLTSSTLSVHSLPYHPPPVSPLNHPPTLRKFTQIRHDLTQPKNLTTNSSGELIALTSAVGVRVYSLKHTLPQTTLYNTLIPCFTNQPPTSKLRLTHDFKFGGCVGIEFFKGCLMMSFMDRVIIGDLGSKKCRRVDLGGVSRFLEGGGRRWGGTLMEGIICFWDAEDGGTKEGKKRKKTEKLQQFNVPLRNPVHQFILVSEGDNIKAVTFSTSYIESYTFNTSSKSFSYQKIADNSGTLNLVRYKNGFVSVTDRGSFEVFGEEGLKETKCSDPGVITSLSEFEEGFIMCNDSSWVYSNSRFTGGSRKNVTCSDSSKSGVIWSGGKSRILENGVEKYEGHTETILAVVCGTVNGVEYVVSLGDDKTIKIWSEYGKKFKCHVTSRVEGNKGGTCLGVSGNGKYLGVGGGDKVGTVYSVLGGREIKKISRLKGHKRSINDITFSPVDRIVLTCGGEGLVKVWNLTGENVRSFQGHSGTVVKGVFTRDGGRVWTGDGQGIMKCWSVKSSMCVGTTVGHDGPVWGMCWVGEDLITGGGDGKVIRWKDNSEETRVEMEKLKDEEDLKNQELMNCMYKGEYLNAVRIALKMDKPRTCLQALEKAQAGDELKNVIMSLTDDETKRALEYSREWNTRSRNCLIGNLLFAHAVERYGVEGLVDLGVEKLIHAMIGYNERHLNRFDGLIEGGYIVEHVLEQMDIMEEDEGEGVYGMSETKVSKEVFEKVEGRVEVEEGTWVDGVLEVGSDGEGSDDLEEDE